MKRRTILMTTAAAAAGLATSAKGSASAASGTARTSRYGAAGSYSSEIAAQRLGITRMTLSMSRAGLSPSAIAPAAAIVSATTDLMTSETARSEFLSNPGQFLSNYKVGTSQLGEPSQDTIDVAVLRGLISDDVRAAVAEGDVDRMLRAMEANHVVTAGQSSSVLADHLASMMQRNHESVAPMVAHLLKSLDLQGKADFAGLEFNVLAELMKKSQQPSPQCSVAAAACLAYIAVVAYVYVIAGAVVIAGVTLATQVGVFGDNMEEMSTGPGAGYLMAKFAPDEVRRYAVAARMAKVQGRVDLLTKIHEVLYKKEVVVIVDALERSGYFSFQGKQRAQIETAMLNYLGTTLTMET